MAISDYFRLNDHKILMAIDGYFSLNYHRLLVDIGVF